MATMIDSSDSQITDDSDGRRHIGAWTVKRRVRG